MSKTLNQSKIEQIQGENRRLRKQVRSLRATKEILNQQIVRLEEECREYCERAVAAEQLIQNGRLVPR